VPPERWPRCFRHRQDVLVPISAQLRARSYCFRCAAARRVAPLRRLHAYVVVACYETSVRRPLFTS
jgi:hypothetical protein